MEPYDEGPADRKIRSMLDDFETNIDRYRAALNREGMWLFLAILGCWGVSDPKLRFVAFWITAFLFGHRLFSQLRDKRPFSRMKKDLMEAIRLELQYGNLQAQRLEDLRALEKRKLSLASHFKATYVYLVCYGYLAWSYVHFMESK